MTQLSPKLIGVPRTMLMTTRARVEEHQRADALFRDPKVFAWWQSIAWDSLLDQLWSPFSQFTWAVRAHTFDQMVTHFTTILNMSNTPEDKKTFSPWFATYCNNGKNLCGEG